MAPPLPHDLLQLRAPLHSEGERELPLLTCASPLIHQHETKRGAGSPPRKAPTPPTQPPRPAASASRSEGRLPGGAEPPPRARSLGQSEDGFLDSQTITISARVAQVRRMELFDFLPFEGPVRLKDPSAESFFIFEDCGTPDARD